MGFIASITAFFKNIQSMFTVIMVAANLAMLVAGYLYYKINQHNIAVLTQNNATLTAAFNTQQSTIATLQQQSQQQVQQLNTLQTVLQQSDQEARNTILKIQGLNITPVAHSNVSIATDLVNTQSTTVFNSIKQVTAADKVAPK